MARNIIQVTPFMHVPDLEAAIAFMAGILGLTVDFRQSNYAYVSREGGGLRMVETGPGDPFQPGTRRFAYYFDCRDGRAARGAQAAPRRPRQRRRPWPGRQAYRQRELAVLGPDGI